MEHDLQAYHNRKVIVFGLAKSGQAVAKLFHQHGAKVTVNDRKPRNECPEADALEQSGIEVICGSHPDQLINEQVALVVKNPGIPYEAPPIVSAMRLGIEVVTEVEVAYHLSQVPFIAVTGSNGKTSTVSLIGHMMKLAQKPVAVAGNIGTPLCEAVQQITDEEWIVTELSSFQLKGTHHYRPHIACLLNVYETHLDYHHTMDDYVQSKVKMFANQREEDTAVLNADDVHCQRIVDQLKAKVMLISTRSSIEREGVYVDDRQSPDPIMYYRDAAGNHHPILAVSEIGIPGWHNVENALAAVAVCIAAHVPLAAIAEGMRTFHGVEHRLEYIAEKEGVTFYNDSKSTNPISTCKALDTFERPIVLIAGGKDRGSQFKELVPYFRTSVKALIAYGETRDQLAAAAREAGLKQIDLVDTRQSDGSSILYQSIRHARQFATSGDIVLLSPACASWDLFTSYEQRGRMFKDMVHNL